ncbi:MAG: DUF3244 domain-containing protein [Bacteroidales bacterium]|nr:DUF3244 domain-containing protein [Bacteroidales bacterium]
MKTLVLTTALVVLTTITFAQSNNASVNQTKTETAENVVCNLYPSADNQVTLILSKADGEKVDVRLKDDEGSLLYNDRIKKSNKNKITYDITELPKGTYTFEVLKDREVVYSKEVRKGVSSVALSK